MMAEPIFVVVFEAPLFLSEVAEPYQGLETGPKRGLANPDSASKGLLTWPSILRSAVDKLGHDEGHLEGSRIDAAVIGCDDVEPIELKRGEAISGSRRRFP